MDDQLIIRALQGRATPAGAEALRRWRAASTENEVRYTEISRLWHLTAPTAATDLPATPDAARVIAAASREHSPPRPLHARRSRLPALGRAAAVAGLLLGGALVGRLWPDPAPGLAASEIVTGASEMVTTRLNDGSTVRIAPHSRLRVEPGTEGREVWLEGQAFFAVTERPDAPFTVHTRGGDALVLGTRFEVRATEDDVRVVVVEGRVALAAEGERVEVAAGELSHAGHGSPPRVEPAGDLRPMLAWMDGFLVFQNTPLRQVAQEIEARYGVEVRLPDGPVADRTVSAWFTTEEVGEVLSVVCRVVGARCTLQGSTATIEG